MAPPTFPPHIMSSAVLSCHGRCCWCRSHFPCPAWSLSSSQLKNTFAPHASSMSLSDKMWLSVCETLCIVMHFSQCLLIIYSFECLVFLNVVSICCLLICGLGSVFRVLKWFSVCSIVLCPPLLECGLAQLCMADVLCVLALIWMQQAYNCLET